MISSQTLERLAHYLFKIGEAEKEIEIVRQVLIELEEFNPYSAFLRLSRKGGGFVIYQDIQNFLSQNAIEVEKNHIQYLLKQYEAGISQKLSYGEFLNLILPNSNAAIRHIPTDKEPTGRADYLPYDVEWALSRVLHKELENNEKLYFTRKDLLKRWDFSFREAFKAIDLENFGYIDYDCLSSFLRENGYPLSEDDIMYILRRTDKDQDGKLTYTEFVDSVFLNSIKIILDENLGVSPYSHNARSMISHNKNKSELSLKPRRNREDDLEDQEEREKLLLRKEQLKKDIEYLKSKYLSSKDNSSEALYATPEKASNHRRIHESPSRVSATRRRLYNDYSFNQMDDDITLDEKYNRKVLDEEIDKQNRSILSREHEIPSSEKKRTHEILSSEKKRAYDVEEETRQTIYESQMKRRELEDNLRDLENRYLSSSKRTITPLRSSPIVQTESKRPITAGVKTEVFSVERERSKIKDFSSGKTESKHLERTPVREVKKRLDFHERQDNISTQRKVNMYESLRKNDDDRGLVSILRNHIESDRKIQSLKNELALKSDFNLLDVFRFFDANENAIITIREMISGLERLNLHFNHEDLRALIRSYDKEHIGNLRYSDFSELFTPRSYEYAAVLNNRLPKCSTYLTGIKRKPFSEETQILIGLLLKEIIRSKKNSENIKESVYGTANFSLGHAFNLLDREEKGFVSLEELRSALLENGIFV